MFYACIVVCVCTRTVHVEDDLSEFSRVKQDYKIIFLMLFGTFVHGCLRKTSFCTHEQ